VGALTLKSFPFELRGWDIEKFESIDPTDGFGSNTRVYISKNSVVQIEPDYDVSTYNTWITDKGRQFFDGAFGAWVPEVGLIKAVKRESLTNALSSIIKSIYVHDHCNTKKGSKKNFTLVFENASLEVLSTLLVLSQKYSFIRLRRAENFNLNNDLESNYLLNLASNRTKLNYSNLCVIISTNPRYEGFYLNLSLRQRHRKGHFKCLLVGSLVHLTFPTTFLGSNLKVIKSMSEGNHLTCRDLNLSKNPVIVANNDILKRKDHSILFSLLKALNQNNTYSKVWNGLNILAPSLSEPGNQTLAKFQQLTATDLNSFSVLYMINSITSSTPNIKKIIELKALDDVQKRLATTCHKCRLLLEQNSTNQKNLTFLEELNSIEKRYPEYFFLPSNIFYENEETYINTEGVFKRTTKLISRKKTRSNWQTLRKLLGHLKSNLTFLNYQENSTISYSIKRAAGFKNYTNFQFYATQSLTSLSFYSCTRTRPFTIYSNEFKQKSGKIFSTKLKYWLDDFFSGGKDEFSQKSLVLTNCSRILRLESTNFF